MSITQIISAFAHDQQVGIVVSLILADFVFGIAAAAKQGTFRLTYVANLARNDLLGKVVPWFGVFALDKASHAAGIVGPIDWSQANTAAFALVTAALVGSVLSSLRDLGVGLPTPIAGKAPAAGE